LSGPATAEASGDGATFPDDLFPLLKKFFMEAKTPICGCSRDPDCPEDIYFPVTFKDFSDGLGK